MNTPAMMSSKVSVRVCAGVATMSPSGAWVRRPGPRSVNCCHNICCWPTINLGRSGLELSGYSAVLMSGLLGGQGAKLACRGCHRLSFRPLAFIYSLVNFSLRIIFLLCSWAFSMAEILWPSSFGHFHRVRHSDPFSNMERFKFKYFRLHAPSGIFHWF